MQKRDRSFWLEATLAVAGERMKQDSERLGDALHASQHGRRLTLKC
ncbi:MAG TPA: hypothetical protein V6C85_11390 [Allocoleopsis sp.]